MIAGVISLLTIIQYNLMIFLHVSASCSLHFEKPACTGPREPRGPRWSCPPTCTRQRLRSALRTLRPLSCVRGRAKRVCVCEKKENVFSLVCTSKWNVIITDVERDSIIEINRYTFDHVCLKKLWNWLRLNSRRTMSKIAVSVRYEIHLSDGTPVSL